jgi:pyruvate formate lyase activating enzyme
MENSMITGGIIFSSLEYPSNMSLVIFTGGCLLRCPYCHNPEIIDGGDPLTITYIENKIDEACDFIDAVVITGGEPTMQIEEVHQILDYAKSKGLKTKLDTNGCYPERLHEIIELVDYVALDVKAPFNKYNKIIGAEIGENVKKSMGILSNANCFLECRTTYVPGLLEPSDIMEIARNVQCDIYTLQQFRNKVVLDEKLKNTPNTPPKELKDIALKIKPLLGKVKIKTAEFGDEIL